MLHTVLTIIQVFASAFIIGLVLLQRGRGAEAGAGFGAGASGTMFGARGAVTGLSRTTAVLAAVFMINSLALAYSGKRAAAPPKTILDQLTTETVPPPAPIVTTPPVVTSAPVTTTAPAATAPPASKPVPKQ